MQEAEQVSGVERIQATRFKGNEMNPQPKEKPYRSKKYLEYIRGLKCTICYRPAEPHHVRREWLGAGMSQKPTDLACVPRCRGCHELLKEESIEAELFLLLATYLRRQGYGRDVVLALIECAKRCGV